MIPTTDFARIRLRDVEVAVKCGLHPWERHPERPTRLLIDVDLYAPLAPGPMAQGSFINYDHVRDFLRKLPDRPHIDLLETIVDDIVDACFALEPVQACRVCVTKPDIFNEAAGAGVDVTRTRASWTTDRAR
jgi:dihydroneopterin aldolase